MRGGDGAEVIYALRNSDAFASKIAKELTNAGQNVRKYYQRRLPSNPAKDYYYLHRDTPNNETVIVEYGFADSSGDDVNQLKNNWEPLAEAVVKAITEYAGGKYVAPVGSNYYTVQKGDSLWSIAKKFGITVDELKEANNLSGNLLNIGQNLFIPNEEEEIPSGDDIYYIVKKGDSLYSIASKYNTTVMEIKKLNNLTSNTLSIGQRLLIKKVTPTKGKTYMVEKGDSLYSIAQKFNTTVDNLKALNNLATDVLSIGQVLVIPEDTNLDENKEIYIVKSGDTLYGIAQKYGISVDDLKKANNLTNNTLSIGQSLIIPSVDKESYIVQAGDTLYSIARKFDTSVSAIVELNNLATNVLSVGQKLLIP